MEQPPPATPPVEELPVVQGPSLMSRLANVLAVPGEVFDYVKAAPASVGNWLVPALITMLVGWVGGWLIMSQPAVQQQISEMSERAIEKQIEKSKMSEQQAEQMRQVAAKYGGIGQKVSMVVLPILSGFASPFVWGFILWVGGRLVVRRPFPYMKAVEVTGLSNVVGILDSVIKTLLVLVMGTLWAVPGPALFISEFNPENPLHGILAAVNVMTFWLLTVRAVGLSRLSGASLGKCAAWVFGVWVAYTGFFMGIGFAMRAVFGK